MNGRVLLFIPVYNCEKQIYRVLDKVDAKVQACIAEIIVIDNQSRDGTVQAAIAAARRLSVKTTILRNRQNYSLGGSIKRAFLYALENGFDAMVTLHGDDQADIRDLLPSLENAAWRNNDLVIGARFHPQSRLSGYSWFRRIGNRGLNLVCAAVCRCRVDDLIAGLNLYRRSFFHDRVS